MSFYAGFDLGGTQLKYGLIDGHGNPVFKAKIPTPPSIQGLMDLFDRLWRELRNKWGNELQAAGLGFPGIYSLRARKILQSPNYPGLDNFDLSAALTRMFDAPFWVDNDANLAAFGEFACGAGQGSQSLILLTLGTGVGSGIILDGDIWHGACGFAGEMGHITVRPEGEWCKCGNRGCLETEAAAPAIVRNYWRLSDTTEAATAEDVFHRAEAGDQAARGSFALAGAYLGIGLGIALNFMNPDKILIGGGVMAAAPYIIPHAVEEARKRSWQATFACCSISTASLGNDAGFLGAAAWAKKQAQQSGTGS